MNLEEGSRLLPLTTRGSPGLYEPGSIAPPPGEAPAPQPCVWSRGHVSVGELPHTARLPRHQSWEDSAELSTHPVC